MVDLQDPLPSLPAFLASGAQVRIEEQGLGSTYYLLV
jgi:hypothetical protein